MKNYMKLLIIATFVVTIALPLKAAVIPSKVLPKDTVAAFSISNLSELVEKSKDTGFGQILNTPEIQGSIESVKANLIGKLNEEYEKSNDAELKLFIDIAQGFMDGKSFPSGMISFGIVLGEDSTLDGPFGLVIICDFGENWENIKQTLQEKILDKMISDESVKNDRIEFKGKEIYTFDIMENNSHADPASIEGIDHVQQINVVFDSQMMITVDIKTDAVKNMINLINGESGESLYNTEAYQKNMRRIGTGDIEAYINIESILNFPFAEEWPMFRKALGLDSLKSMSYIASYSPDKNVDGIVKQFMRIEGEKSGLVKLLDFKQSNTNVPSFLDNEADSISGIGIDLEAAYDEIFKSVSSINPMIAGMMGSPMLPPAQEGELGQNIKDGIISKFGNQVYISQQAVLVNDMPSQKTLFCLEIKDKAGLENNIGGMYMQMMPGTPERKVKEMLGHKIYVIDPIRMSGQIPNDPETMALAEQSRMGFTFTDKYMILGDLEQVVKAVRSIENKDVETISSLDWYKRCIKEVPSKNCAFSVVNVKKQLKAYWALKSNFDDIKAGENEIFKNEEELLDIIKDIKLPEFDQIEKYLGYSVGYSLSENDGLYTENIILRK